MIKTPFPNIKKACRGRHAFLCVLERWLEFYTYGEYYVVVS